MSEPTHYTAEEGGTWLEWTAGPIDGRTLRKRDKRAVEFNGIQVHAFKMDDGRIWDCVNGWRPEPAAVVEGADVAEKLERQLNDSRLLESAAMPSPAQAYALRVWNGQSPDTLTRQEREARVAAALAGQGWSMEGIELP